MIPVWTENIAVTLSDASPANTITSTGDVDLGGGGYDMITMQISISWHASASGYADLFFYTSVDGGVTWDTVGRYNRRPDASPGNTTILSQDVPNVPRIRVAVQNQSGQEIALLEARYAGRKWARV